MDINWRQEYEAAVIERNGLIMALMAAEKRESAALSRAEAAEQRVAELEAQLAAQAWRPVTEPPIEDGWYDVYAPDFKDYGEFQDTARWERSEWFVYGEPISPTHWAKLRPAPTPPPTAGAWS